MIYTIIALSILLLLFAFFTINLFRKMDSYEQVLESYEQYILNLSNLIEESNKVIDVVDSKGHFRTDDEIEVFFQALKTIQSRLNEFTLERLALGETLSKNEETKNN